MLAQVVDANPNTFEAFIIVALIAALLSCLMVYIKQRRAAFVIGAICVIAFIASFLWLT